MMIINICLSFFSWCTSTKIVSSVVDCSTTPTSISVGQYVGTEVGLIVIGLTVGNAVGLDVNWCSDGFSVGVFVVGLTVVGVAEVGLDVVGIDVVGATVVGAAVVGISVVGMDVVGLIVGDVEGIIFSKMNLLILKGLPFCPAVTYKSIYWSSKTPE